MLKKEARKLFKEKREAVSYSDRLKWDDLILIQLQSLGLPFIEYILSFYPIEEYKEINSFLLTDYLHFKNPNLHICYPKMKEEKGEMQAVVCNADSVFESNKFGILEPLDTDIAAPEKLDIIIIPLLAFDERGYRVGYGKGFYDRYLINCREDCLKIGVSYFDAIEAVDDAADFDIPLNFCITPQQIYVF